MTPVELRISTEAWGLSPPRPLSPGALEAVDLTAPGASCDCGAVGVAPVPQCNCHL